MQTAPTTSPNEISTPGWFTPAEEAARQRAYEDMLVARFNQGLHLGKLDKAEARKIIKARAQET